ncbi:MAG: SulP family inorganic anion transporter [Opitutaceae bacterium]
MKLSRILNQSRLKALLLPRVARHLRLLPAIETIRGYDRAALNQDASAGLQVALLALPQGLAFALIAGLPAQHGVYASIAGLLLGSLFTGARHASFGPSLTIAVLIMSTFVQLDVSPKERASVVIVLLILSGLILCVGAVLRFALLARYISRSVITGFVVATGILIFSSQLKHVLGLSLPETGVFVSDLRATILDLPSAQWQSLLVGMIALGCYLAFTLRLPRWPAAAIAVAASSVAAWFLERGGHPIVHLDDFQAHLIPSSRTGFDARWIGVIASTAFATALLSHLEASMIGRSYSARAGERFDANQTMLGLGLTNLGNALLAGMPSSISLSRSRINWRMRAATPMTGSLAALFCAALFAGVAPFLHYLPRPALSTLAMALATEIVSRHYLRVIFRSSRADAIVLIATIAAGLLFRLDIALYAGAGLSIVFFLRRVGVPELSEYGFTDEGHLAAMAGAERRNPDISIVHVEGDLFFGAAEIFLEQARRVCEDPNLKVIVLRMKNAHHLDATCALAIQELLRFARDHGRHIIVSGAHRQIYRVFKNSGLLEMLGRDNFFMDVPSNPTISTRNALKRAQKLLGGAEANIRIYVDPAKQAAQTAGQA